MSCTSTTRPAVVKQSLLLPGWIRQFSRNFCHDLTLDEFFGEPLLSSRAGTQPRLRTATIEIAFSRLICIHQQVFVFVRSAREFARYRLKREAGVEVEQHCMRHEIVCQGLVICLERQAVVRECPDSFGGQVGLSGSWSPKQAIWPDP